MLFFISIKAAWLPKILYECDTWSCIAQMHVLSIADTTSITNFHFEKENCLDKINALPTFYKDVISSYAFIENIITNKRDIWRQMALMKKALKPLIPLIGDHTPQITDSNDINVTKLTVNNFYKTLTEHSDTKKYSPFQVWENIIGQSCDCKAALKQKNLQCKKFHIKRVQF